MIFSIGNHIAFKIPFVEGTNPADMTIRTPNTTQLLRGANGLPNGESKENSFDNPRRLGDFDASVALPLAGYHSTPYALLSDPQGLAVRLGQQSSALCFPNRSTDSISMEGPRSVTFVRNPGLVSLTPSTRNREPSR